MNLKFKELGISDYILEVIDKLGFESPTEIQKLAIPHVLADKDVIGQAQTGTGKTFAYGIPIIEKIDVNNRNIQALVLCPTRELSLQVSVELNKLIEHTKSLKVATVYGGESYERQIRAIKQNPQIIVGTPGRIIDHMNRKTLNFSNLKMLVLDEADEMLKMGFQEDLETILSTTPVERQTLLFSATMPPFIKTIARKYQQDPVHVTVVAKTLTVERIRQELYVCKRDSKIDLLIRLLDMHNFNSSIIFCNTKSKVDELVTFLQKSGYSVDGLHGDLKQMVRDRVMNSFRTNSINILVATDVAARGIDVYGVEAIINFDIPQENEVYVHRIGRTGRAGSDGLSITMSTPREQFKVKEVESYTKSKMNVMPIPQVSDIKNKIMNSLYQDITANIKELDDKLDYDKLLNKLSSEGYLALDILKALINIAISDKNREYNKIDVVEEKRRRDLKEKSSKDSFNKGRSKKMMFAKLNIGKKELLRPQIILSICDTMANVRKENIGDIRIKKSGTYLEITQDGFKYLKALNGKKYQGTKIVVSEATDLGE